VIDHILEDDGVTGDQYGPFDAETIKEERQRLKGEKVSGPRSFLLAVPLQHNHGGAQHSAACFKPKLFLSLHSCVTKTVLLYVSSIF